MNCPFCKVEMFRPRADMKTSGIVKMKLVGGDDHAYETLSNDVPIGDAPLLTFSDSVKQTMEYYDYMCPQCKIVLFYGEKV